MDYISGLIPQDTFRSGLRKLAQGIKLRNSMSGRMWYDITNDECHKLARQLEYMDGANYSEIAEVMSSIRQTAGITPEEVKKNPDLLEKYAAQREQEIKEDIVLIDLAITELCKDGGFVEWTTTGEWESAIDKVTYTVRPTEITKAETADDKRALLRVILAVCQRYSVTITVNTKGLNNSISLDTMVRIHTGTPMDLLNEIAGKLISQ